ncbi:MAG TPA: hypothetical protein VF091_00395 [Gaiellaceae bacterium]
MTMQPGFEVEQLVLELAGLVQREELLALRGADDDELEEHRLQIERTRWRLANAARRRARADGPAAA